MDRNKLLAAVERLRERACAVSDAIFDHPEVGRTERFACRQLADFLEAEGFQTQRGVGGLDTAFRGVWQNGEGGPVIGFACEYDALRQLGHGCGHHMQGPAVIAAAAALKAAAAEEPFHIVVYGTPDEEYGNGKIDMLEQGCFQELDFVLMTHLGPNTTVDLKSLAQRIYLAEYHGQAAHAAVKPEAGRSAVDAMLLSLHGLEMLREHVRDDVRMHYSILETSPNSNTVPAYAKIEYNLRANSSDYLDQICRRFEKVMEGAAIMSGTTVDYSVAADCKSKIPMHLLTSVLMKHAQALNAPQMIPFRERTGTTDAGNLMRVIPGASIRVACMPERTPLHSQAVLDAGKSQALHDGLLLAAKILALTGADLICDGALRRDIRAEFEQNLAAEQKEAAQG